MELMNVEKSFDKWELDCNKDIEVCDKCGDPIQKDIEILNKVRRVPIVCKCKKKEQELKVKQEEAQEKQDRLKQIFKNSLMDEKFKNATFKNWDHIKGSKKIYNISLKYAKAFKEAKENNLGLMFYGEPGNGKTYAASCIANYLMSKGYPVICVSIIKLLERIKETYNSYGKEGEETVLKSFANADLLIIDDLGTEQTSDWSITRIYNIIDSRYRSGLPTIITTNVTVKSLEDIYNKRTYDRLLEMCTPVFNDTESIRAKEGIEKTKLLKEILS